MPLPEAPRETDERTEDWWSLLDGEVLDCLTCGGALSPEEVGEKLGMRNWRKRWRTRR